MIRIGPLVLLGVTVLLCLVGLSGRASMSAPAHVIKWEYKVVLAGHTIDKDTEDEIDKAGADGWELAGIFTDVHTGGLGAGPIGTIGYLIFKRIR